MIDTTTCRDGPPSGRFRIWAGRVSINDPRGAILRPRAASLQNGGRGRGGDALRDAQADVPSA